MHEQNGADGDAYHRIPEFGYRGIKSGEARTDQFRFVTCCRAHGILPNWTFVTAACCVARAVVDSGLSRDIRSADRHRPLVAAPRGADRQRCLLVPIAGFKMLWTLCGLGLAAGCLLGLLRSLPWRAVREISKRSFLGWHRSPLRSGHGALEEAPWLTSKQERTGASTDIALHAPKNIQMERLAMAGRTLGFWR